jgi:hypothetical protein
MLGSHLRMRITLIDVVPHIVVAWLVATMVACAKVTPEQNENWVSYHSHALNYSFKHPPELRLIRRSVPEFRMEGLVEAVDLVSESDSVLRVMVFEPAGNPLAPVYDFKFLKEVCRNYGEFQIHDRTAVNCVTCGRASCQWRVYVPGAREYRIFSLTSIESEKPMPEDGRFPLRSIINSFMFGANRNE